MNDIAFKMRDRLRQERENRIEDAFQRAQLSFCKANVVTSDFNVAVIFERTLDRVVQ